LRSAPPPRPWWPCFSGSVTSSPFGACGRHSSCCSPAAARISSTSQCRFRAGSKTAIVRYDAYEQSGGHQSASVAMLDAARTGVVLSAIQGRDYARIYIKELDRGRASVALSPEELEAVERAMSS
jgi:hypothetical protein